MTPKWVNRELGEGWSSVVKVRDRLYLNCLASDNSKKESVVCLDLDGKKLWEKPVGAVWSGSYPLPRSTPTCVPGSRPSGDRLVVLSGAGELFCLAASNGRVLWSKELAKPYETQFGNWGMAESVIVEGGTVYVTVCGRKAFAVALKLSNGDLVWESPAVDDRCAYVTPILHDGQLIIMTAKYVTGLDVKSGKRLWQDDYQQTVGPSNNPGILCVTPLVKGNQFFVTGGYDQGCAMYEILPGGKGIEKRWAHKTLDTHHGGVVEHEGRIYGSNWLNNGAGNWVCLDWNTGETVYEQPWERFGKGAVIFADGMLYLYEEKRGTLGLAKPGDKLDVVSRFQIDFGTKEHWAHPVVSDGVLYVRHGNSLAAFDIKEKN